jgi:cytosine/adenosine deaminase-related metal-dependent hydrolase
MFAQWMLTFHGLPFSALGAPKSLLSFGSLVRHFLTAYVALLKSRRINTGPTPHVGVKLAMFLLQSMKMERLLTLEGPEAAWSFSRYQMLSLRTLDQPYFISQIAALADVPVEVVRNSCRSLEELGQIQVVDSHTVKVGGPHLTPEMILAAARARLFYSVEMEQGLIRFTRNALARAERLAKNPGSSAD